MQRASISIRYKALADIILFFLYLTNYNILLYISYTLYSLYLDLGQTLTPKKKPKNALFPQIPSRLEK